jgi:putative nucleotidyltransferase with HDIG domain
MKLFRGFSKPLEPGRQRHRSKPGTLRLGKQPGHPPTRFSNEHANRLWLQVSQAARLGQDWLCPPARRRKSSFSSTCAYPRVYALLAVLTLTSVIGYRFYNEPQLAVGTIAPQTLRAAENATVLDSKSTEEKRMAARLGALPVLMIDPAVNQRVYQSIQRLLDEGDAIRQMAGPFPYVSTGTLSTATQSHLRQTSKAEWESILAAVESTPSRLPLPAIPSASSGREPTSRSAQQLAILELQNQRRSISEEDFSALKRVIVRARQNYANALAELSTPIDGVPRIYSPTVLQLSDTEWLDTKVKIRRALERILTQGVAPGLPNSILKDAIRIQMGTDLPANTLPLASTLLLSAIEPNLIQDPAQTRLQAEQAAQAVEPVMVTIRRGEVIVNQGDVITQEDFVLLDHFGLSQRGINWFGLISFATLVSGGVAAFLLLERRFHPGFRRRDYVLVMLLVLSTPVLLAFGASTSTLPAVGLLVSTFYGSPLGATVVAFLSLALPLGMNVGSRHLFASSVSSLLGAVMAGRLRSREEIALLGGAVGLTQGLVYLLLSLIVSSGSGIVWYTILMASVTQGLLGVAWSIVALGISPYLEQAFDLVTPIRLVELSNPNRPLLKRLAEEAPGTFQHTLFVSTLAEAAARELGCNVELVRAGTLYHDIGKMHDPLGFIENQMGGPNKHDSINDPWISASIIKKHVTEGEVMARRYRLPRAIRAFIPEHQGTMLVGYFFHEAQQRAKADPSLTLREADFRYDGPIPQSRETGIVMLADSCEAALRSLKEATPKDALAMVNRILYARWQDNQLVDSGLERAEMPRIAEVFVQVWQQFNHQRIAYPKAIAAPKAPAAEVK